MTHRLIDVFASDARKYVARLRTAVVAESEYPDADAVRRSARRLHHSAVLANHEAVMRASSALQKTAVQVIAGKRKWSKELAGILSAAVLELETVISALPGNDADAERRLRGLSDQLMTYPVPTAEPLKKVPEELDWKDHERDIENVEDAELILSGLIVDLGAAVERLESDPRDREPLKLMLRKIRRLRELGRIEILSPQDKALSAVEELILQIADLNATVGPGYLTVFAHAREVLEEMRGESVPSITQVGGRAVEVDRLKDQVMERVRRSRQVIWVSDLFFPEGPHVVTCPLAEQQGGVEPYFTSEATQRLERSENLRKTMLEANTEQTRLAGESLSHTLRHLRERAAAFNHGEFGRVTRRAAAALRVQLVRPPKRLKQMADGFGGVFAALRAYLETEDEAARARAVGDADAALHLAILGGGEPQPHQGAVEFDPDMVLEQALLLRTRVDERLSRIGGAEAEALRQDLDQLFDLISRYLSASAGHE